MRYVKRLYPLYTPCIPPVYPLYSTSSIAMAGHTQDGRGLPLPLLSLDVALSPPPPAFDRIDVAPSFINWRLAFRMR